MSAIISSTGQWTRLATDLTPLQDIAKPVIGNLPALDPSDLRNLPEELYDFIQLAAQGFARSFFEATDVATGTTQLNVLATALLVREMLTFFLERGWGSWAHEGIGTRGQL